MRVLGIIIKVLLGGYPLELGGGFMLFLGIVMLSINEGNVVNAKQALFQGSQEFVNISSQYLDPSADKKLIHTSGMLAFTKNATDPDFGISGTNIVRLKRTVLMYQWTETQHADGRGKSISYSYDQEWVDHPVDSSAFKYLYGHTNPPTPINGTIFNSEGTKLGVYQLGNAVIDKLDEFKPLPLDQSVQAPKGYERQGDIYFRGTGTSGKPAIGDIKVSFSAIQATPISVVAGLIGNTLVEYQGSNGYSIVMAKPGTIPASEFFKSKQAEEGSSAWGKRVFAGILIVFGFMLFRRPLVSLLAFSSTLQYIAKTGMLRISLLLSPLLITLIIALAWISYRPLWSIGSMVGVSIACWAASEKMGKIPSKSVTSSIGSKR